jgi:hypothetical protein
MHQTKLSFGKPAPKAAAAAAPAAPTPAERQLPRSAHAPAEPAAVAAYYASLADNALATHVRAAEMLGSSYDVERTHGFTKWRLSTSKPSQ